MAAIELDHGAGKRQRVPAAERRDALIDAAMVEFARGGLHGTPVANIARRVGVAQPYVFSLFPTKRELFIAAVERGFETVITRFAEVRQGFEPDPADPSGSLRAALGEAYIELLQSNRALLMLQLHAYAACGEDEEIRTHVRRCYTELEQRLRSITQLGDTELQKFLSIGMWLNVQAALGTGDLADACAWIVGPEPQATPQQPA